MTHSKLRPSNLTRVCNVPSVRLLSLVATMTKSEWDSVNRQRAKDGFGPFLDTYDNYLKVVKEHNTAARGGAA